MNHGLVFEVVNGAIVDQVDRRPQVVIDDAAVRTQASVPLVWLTPEVRDDCLGLVQSHRAYIGVGANEVQLDRPTLHGGRFRLWFRTESCGAEAITPQ